MITFLPSSSFEESAKILDYKRLGNQRVEANLIRKTILGGGRWINHPAVRMWLPYYPALLLYRNEMIKEWISRGFKNAMSILEISELIIIMPIWLGNPLLHSSHRSNLLRKDPTWYGQFGWIEKPDMQYWWPVSTSKGSI